MNELRITKRNSIAADAIAHTEVETFIETKDIIQNDGLGSRWKFWIRRRYIVVIMIFFGELAKSILRSNLSIAVFPMTENYTTTDENGTQIYVQDFDWDAKTRGFLLSVFNYGYVVASIPGGLLALKYGGGTVYGIGVLLTAISTLLTPVGASIHVYLLVALRIFEGMCEGILVPCLDLTMSNWIPMTERSTCLGITISGTVWGQVVGVAASGSIGALLGWRAIFYCSGGVGVLWYIAWFILVKDHPKLDKKILLSELSYIHNYSGRFQYRKIKVSSIPYTKIMTSVPVWSIMISNLALAWVLTTSHTHTPTYIKDVLKLNYQKSGYLSSVPFAMSLVAVYFVSPIADMLTTKKIFTFTTVRKLYISGGLTMMALVGFLIQHVTSIAMVVLCLTIIQVFVSVCLSQLAANILDIAPRYSSVLGGLGPTIVSLCGMFTPTATGYLTQNKTPEEWHIVFSIQSGFCLVGALMYGLFASGQLQPWATESELTKLREDEDK